LVEEKSKTLRLKSQALEKEFVLERDLFPAVSESVTSKQVSITLPGSGAGPGEGSP